MHRFRRKHFHLESAMEVRVSMIKLIPIKFSSPRVRKPHHRSRNQYSVRPMREKPRYPRTFSFFRRQPNQCGTCKLFHCQGRVSCHLTTRHHLSWVPKNLKSDKRPTLQFAVAARAALELKFRPQCN